MSHLCEKHSTFCVGDLKCDACEIEETERERIIAFLISSDKIQVWIPEAGDLYPVTANDLRKLLNP